MTKKAEPQPKRVEMSKPGMTNANPLEQDVPDWEAAGWSRVKKKDDGK